MYQNLVDTRGHLRSRVASIIWSTPRPVKLNSLSTRRTTRDFKKNPRGLGRSPIVTWAPAIGDSLSNFISPLSNILTLYSRFYTKNKWILAFSRHTPLSQHPLKLNYPLSVLITLLGNFKKSAGIWGGAPLLPERQRLATPLTTTLVLFAVSFCSSHMFLWIFK
jgi:hypothetical protein